MSAEEHKAIERRWFEALNKRDLSVIGEIFSTDHVDHIAGDTRAVDLEDMKQDLAQFFDAFPDCQYTLDDLIAEGDKVVNRWTSTGTHKGEFMGVAPTGKQVTVTGIGVDRFAGGKIVETWLERDRWGAMQQLGVVPPMGEGV